MTKKSNKNKLPGITEFTDENGKKWIQTSSDDLFSSKEFIDMMDSIEKDKEIGDIILARIDFKRVNKEYLERVVELQAKLKKQNDLLKNLLFDAKTTIERKNNKLKELINYIKKLHLLLAYYKMRPEDFDKVGNISNLILDSEKIDEELEKKEMEYEVVEEIALNDNGEESGRATF